MLTRLPTYKLLPVLLLADLASCMDGGTCFVLSSGDERLVYWDY